MLRLSGNILLSLDYASQEQMDSHVYFLMSELKEFTNSNDKPIEIFVNNSKRITALLANEFQEELHGDYIISFYYNNEDSVTYFDSFVIRVKHMLQYLSNKIDISDIHLKAEFSGRSLGGTTISTFPDLLYSRISPGVQVFTISYPS